MKTGSFDMIGDIAIIEVRKEKTRNKSTKKQKTIAQTILDQHKNIHVILKKKGGHTGKYRQQGLQWLAGQKRFVTEHKESGIRLRVDVQNCYYSPRMGTERLRIAKLVQPAEEILVMFSGIAPYPLVLAKHSPANHITAIEMNPTAHKYAIENVKINKLTHKITLYKGNASKVVPALQQNKKKFDRIIMVLPKSAKRFLKYALAVAKPHAFLHVYAFSKENAFVKTGETIRKLCEQLKKPCTILHVMKAGQNAPRQYRVCVDAELS